MATSNVFLRLFNLNFLFTLTVALPIKLTDMVMDLRRALHLGANPARTHCCPVDRLGRPRPLLLLSPTRFLLSSSLHNFLSSSFCSIAFSLPSLDLGQAELLTRGGWGGGLLLRPRSQLGKSLLLQSLLLSPFLPLPLLLL